MTPKTIVHGNRIPFGKLMLLRNPTVGGHFYFLCVGDSMIRFLQNCSIFKNPMVHVHAISGGLVHQIHNKFVELIRKYPPRLIFIHAGVNNMSKCFLYPNELVQMQVAFKEIDLLAECLKNVTSQSDIIISSLVPSTKDGMINNRSARLNNFIKEVCILNSWTFMDNSNVHLCELRDTVHFNHGGECKFIDNILRAMSAIL